MCGIVSVKKKNNNSVQKAVLKRYYQQKSRGTEGYGYIVIDKGKASVKHAETEREIEGMIKQETSGHIIFHHRFPTSTINHRDCSHPIIVKNDILKSNYYVVHNGVISNPDELRIEHEKLGFKYTTDISIVKIIKTRGGEVTEILEDKFNDTEAFAIDIALYLDKQRFVIDSMGSIAFICVETDKEDNVLRIHYGRNEGSTLVLEENKGLQSIKSQGNGNSIEADMLHTVDYKTDVLTLNDVEIGESYYKKEKMGFDQESNDREIHNIYNCKDGYQFDNESRSEELSEDHPLQIQEGSLVRRRELLSADGTVKGTYDDYDPEQAYIDLYCTEDKLTSLQDQELQLIEDIKLCDLMVTEHDNGHEILKTEDFLYYTEYGIECQEKLIAIRGDIRYIEDALESNGRE